MPELPEVETIKLGLQKKIVGLRIKKVEALSPKSFLGEPGKVEGKIVKGVWRRAKMLGIDLDTRGPASLVSPLVTILFHLKMTGQLIYDDGKKPALPDGSRGRIVGGHPTADMRNKMPNSHTRVVFTFSDNSHLYFNDQRRFGWVKIVDRQQILDSSLFKDLGPEPLEKGFNWQILKLNLLRHKSMPVKVSLMNPKVVAGIGNIYASEACFKAGIDPRVKSVSLTDQQFQVLCKAIVEVLKKGIKYGGSTRAHFVDSEGRKGYFLDYAFVYGKDKHPCKVCKTEIKKIQLAGRGTFFCSNCQKAV